MGDGIMAVTFDTLKAATRLPERAGLAGPSRSLLPSTNCSDAETGGYRTVSETGDE